MTTFLICAFGVLNIAIGFAWARMVYRPQIARAELRGLTNRHVLELSRTPDEQAAGFVS